MILKVRLENDSPSRGRKQFLTVVIPVTEIIRLENDSPSRGRKLLFLCPFLVAPGCPGLENDSPSRGRKPELISDGLEDTFNTV